jgi:oxygen-dependent protoporphyrinogen oxidase
LRTGLHWVRIASSVRAASLLFETSEPSVTDMEWNFREAVVIGAGISGLLCAYRLKTLGVDVALIEKSDCVGGVIQSERINGYLIERGPNSSQGTEELMALVEELGITGEIAEGDPRAPAFVCFNGRLHPVPAGPGAFIKSSLLSARGKLRILAEPFVRTRRSGEEESVYSFAYRRIGREAAERIVAPFVSGIYAGDAQALSVQAAFPRLANLETSYGGLIRGAFAKAREARRAKTSAAAVVAKAAPARRRLVSFRDGMSCLTSTLASRIGEDLMTGCGDCSVRIAGGDAGNATSRVADSAMSDANGSAARFVVSFSGAGRGEEMTCARLIIATPAGAAASLVAPLSEDLSRLLKEITYPPLAIVYLSYDEDAIRTSLRGFGFLVAPSEKVNILGCVWNSSLFKGRAPQGKVLLTVFIGGARNPEVVRLGDAELVSIAHGELQKILHIEREPHPVSITRHERAIPQYNLGHAERVRSIESLLADIPGLSLACNYLHGVSTGDCIKEADRIARAPS